MNIKYLEINVKTREYQNNIFIEEEKVFSSYVGEEIDSEKQLDNLIEIATKDLPERFTLIVNEIDDYHKTGIAMIEADWSTVELYSLNLWNNQFEEEEIVDREEEWDKKVKDFIKESVKSFDDRRREFSKLFL